jgi:imidazolonepropionase-like amidohydrolase
MSRDRAPERLLLAGGTVFDGTSGSSEPGQADVVIEGDRIVDVGVGLDGDHALDCTGLAVLPGLIDCHVHLALSTLDLTAQLRTPFSLPFYQAARNAAATLASGVTTVRDAGGADLGIKTAQEQGLITGPRMQIAISILSQTGGHADGWQPSGCDLPFLFGAHPGRPAAVVDGPHEIRKKARELIRAGADVLKVAVTGGVLSPRDDPNHAHFREDELNALMAEAWAAHLPVMAHAHTAAGITNAVLAGVRSIEHGTVLTDDAIELMADQRVWLVPTLSAPRAVLDPDGPGAALPENILAKGRALAAGQKDAVRRALDAGVPIAMGTDAGVSPHGGNPRELELLVDAGLSPAQALHAATGSAARLLRLDEDLGTVEPGKRADLLLVTGDPLDVNNLPQRVHAVFQNGRAVCGTPLDPHTGPAPATTASANRPISTNREGPQ